MPPATRQPCLCLMALAHPRLTHGGRQPWLPEQSGWAGISWNPCAGGPGGDTHGFPQEEGVPRQVVGAQKAPQDSDSALEQVDIHILLEPELL